MATDRMVGLRLAAAVIAATSLGVAGCATAVDSDTSGYGLDDAGLPKVDSGVKRDAGSSHPPAFDSGGSGVDSGSGNGDDGATGDDDSGAMQSDDAGEDGASPPPPPSDAAGPPPPVDAGMSCVDAPNSTCGLAPQCGCSGGTPTCDITNVGTGAAQCVAAGGTPVRDACKTTSDCSPGLTCWGGACRQYCSANNAACSGPGDPSTCVQQETSSGADEPNMLVCRFNCNLDDPNACGGTDAYGTAGCIVYTDNGTDCRALGTGTDFAGCSGPSDCAPGYACVGNSETYCAPWCQPNGANTCDPSYYDGCFEFNPPLIVNGVEYGACGTF